MATSLRMQRAVAPDRFRGRASHKLACLATSSVRTLARSVSLHQAAFVRPSAAGGQRLRGLASASQVSAPTNDNPFLGGEDIQLLTPAGSSVRVGELLQQANGRVVFCWEQAQALLQANPRFAAAGYKLVIVAIGSPEGGREFCASAPFPPELLLLDPDHQLYTHLQCVEGLKGLFSPNTWQAMRERSWDDFKDVLTKYKMIRPKDAQSTAVMGGVFVLDGNKVLYAHRDPTFGVHAPMNEVLASCC